MFGYGTFAYTLGDVRPLVPMHIAPDDVIAITEEMVIERRRSTTADPQSFISVRYFPGVVEVQDAGGVSIVTDA